MVGVTTDHGAAPLAPVLDGGTEFRCVGGVCGNERERCCRRTQPARLVTIPAAAAECPVQLLPCATRAHRSPTGPGGNVRGMITQHKYIFPWFLGGVWRWLAQSPRRI